MIRSFLKRLLAFKLVSLVLEPLIESHSGLLVGVFFRSHRLGPRILYLILDLFLGSFQNAVEEVHFGVEDLHAEHVGVFNRVVVLYNVLS